MSDSLPLRNIIYIFTFMDQVDIKKTQASSLDSKDEANSGLKIFGCLFINLSHKYVCIVILI